MNGDIMIMNGVYKQARIHSALSPEPVYFYIFTFDGKRGLMKRAVGGSRFRGSFCISLCEFQYISEWYEDREEDLCFLGEPKVFINIDANRLFLVFHDQSTCIIIQCSLLGQSSLLMWRWPWTCQTVSFSTIRGWCEKWPLCYVSTDGVSQSIKLRASKSVIFVGQ
jgi:hypothetical protein